MMMVISIIIMIYSSKSTVPLSSSSISPIISFSSCLPYFVIVTIITINTTILITIEDYDRKNIGTTTSSNDKHYYIMINHHRSTWSVGFCPIDLRTTPNSWEFEFRSFLIEIENTEWTQTFTWFDSSIQNRWLCFWWNCWINSNHFY